MTAPDLSVQIVARFLRANHYNKTLEAFIQEAGLSEDAGTLNAGAWTIEQILQEKSQFDATVNFEKEGRNDKRGWTTPAPTMAQEPLVQISSNVLCVSAEAGSRSVTVTTADRKLQTFSAQAPYAVDDDATQSTNGPVLCTNFISRDLVLTTSMSGHLTLRRSSDFSLIDECRHHSKYAVQVVSHTRGEDCFIATAGWDQKIHIYTIKVLDESTEQFAPESATRPRPIASLGEPVKTISLPSNPESLVFVNHPDTDDLYLIASRRDSTHLYYYLVRHDTPGEVVVDEVGRQNLAPHSNAWVAFTPCSLTLCPTDPTLVAVATSHLPHMKLIIVRLLFPDSRREPDIMGMRHQTQASMARAELALQDREDAAIAVHVTTMAPQTPYSTPQAVWRPDGSGVFVNGDDGVIRGVESTTGKVVSLLKGHEAGSKVRTLWAGLLGGAGDEGGQEVVVSGGFDKKLFVWTIGTED